MALCERCSTEILHGRDLLPAEWFDWRRGAILVPGELPRHVARLPWKILAILWHRRHQGPLSLETMVTLVYDCRDEPEHPENSLRVMVTRLRAQLAGTAYTIRAVFGYGYYLAEISALAEQPLIGPIEPWDGPQPVKRYHNQYPFPWMRPGQSFLVHNGDFATIRGSCYGVSAKSYGDFVASREAAGVRVKMVSGINLRPPTLTMRRTAALAPLRG